MVEFGKAIPVVIQPMFWLLAALIGLINSGTDPIAMILWVLIVFVSVLFHEYGHALMAVFFKQKAKIQLVFLGGLTSFEGPKLKFWQQFLIVLNGPLFGFLLFIGSYFLLKMNFFTSTAAIVFLKNLGIANLFWTVLNLLPVAPLDGGQLLRIVLEGIFSVKGYRASLFISACFAACLVAFFFLKQFFLAAAIFSMFAFESFQMWRKSKYATTDDRNEEHQKMVIQGEIAFQAGDFAKAKQIFLSLIENHVTGLLGNLSNQYLAIIFMKEANHKAAYNLLLDCKDDLMDDTKCILHQLAAEFENHALVCQLSLICYQVAPSFQMAMRNARSFAILNCPKFAGGWLQTAHGYGILNLEKVLQEPCFSKIKEEKEFLDFIKKISKD